MKLLIYHGAEYRIDRFSGWLSFCRAYKSKNDNVRSFSYLLEHDIILHDSIHDVYFHKSETYSYVNSFDSSVVPVMMRDLTNSVNVFYCDITEEYYSQRPYESGDLRNVNGETIGTYCVEACQVYEYYAGGVRYCFEYEEDRDDFANTNDPTYVSSYHSCNSPFICKPATEFRVGFEAEKEDEEVLQSVPLSQFKRETGGNWRKESDSSLSEEAGFELISPVFDLMNVTSIMEHINGNGTLVNHINADYSRKCGGHMTISQGRISGQSLFESISGYIPILFAMYYGRLGNQYCSADKKENLKSSGRKAIYIKSNDCIEFRLFPAIRNVNNLNFRLRFLQFMAKNKTDCFLKAKNNLLQNNAMMLNPIYDKESINKMMNRAEVYAEDYEFHQTTNNYINRG